jgi:signal transduction histidine kinase
MSFRLKTILGIALIELSVMAILITVNQLNYGGSASAQLYRRVQATGDLYASMVADAVISIDLATLDAIVDNTLATSEMSYLRVRNRDGVTLYEAGDQGGLNAPFVADPSFEAALSDHRIDIVAPIEIEGQTYGVVEIGVPTDVVEAEMASALRWNILVALIGMSLVAVFGFLLGSALTRQLKTLQHGARMIAAGDLGYQITVRGRDELADTARCFNDMATTLATDRATLETKQAQLIEKRDRTGLIVESMMTIAAGAQTVHVPDCDRPDEIGDLARAAVVFQCAMREAQEARAEQARLIHAFDQVDEQVAIFGEDGCSIFVNAAFRAGNAEILEQLQDGFTYAAFLSEGCRQSLFPEALGREDEWISKRIAPPQDDEPPSEMARVPGRVLLVRRTLVVGIGLVVSASDVTKLKVSQSQLIQASKLATLGEMATGIAHELNQPLGVIRMASNNCIKRIERGQVDTEYLTAKLQRMADQTERAAQIINHMRIFGRTADESDCAFDVVTAVEDACQLMAKHLSLSGITVHQDHCSEAPQVAGHHVMFEQVILNLLGNAGDAIVDAESDEREVRVATEMLPNGQVSITLEDSGPGVPEAILDRLFDPFFTTKEPGKGTGLGLSISYGIIKEMGGTILATNTARGARFRIDLPVVDPAAIVGAESAVA